MNRDPPKKEKTEVILPRNAVRGFGPGIDPYIESYSERISRRCRCYKDYSIEDNVSKEKQKMNQIIQFSVSREYSNRVEVRVTRAGQPEVLLLTLLDQQDIDAFELMLHDLRGFTDRWVVIPWLNQWGIYLVYTLVAGFPKDPQPGIELGIGLLMELVQAELADQKDNE